jgi:prolyl 3-hydroxylase /prolyl 3,4-dihydroxylase
MNTNPKRLKVVKENATAAQVVAPHDVARLLVEQFRSILSIQFQTAILSASSSVIPVVVSNSNDTATDTDADIDTDIVEKTKTVQLHAKPFPHGVITTLFQTEFLQHVIREIKDHSVVHFKESDLFKVFQSIDLANLPSSVSSVSSVSSSSTDGVSHEQDPNGNIATKPLPPPQTTSPSAIHMPCVLQLRSLLYSTTFRHYMEYLHQLPHNTLTDQIDCACNCHMTGCHLLCHDDVIGTRKLSYILYLTEPDPIWDITEGGVLELYDSIEIAGSSERRMPHVEPCTMILPIFNTMAFFLVQPGYSFHAVQEVLGDRPRLSIQGWYHATSAPENMEYATLQRLKSYHNAQVVQEEDTEGVFTPIQYPINHKGDVEATTSIASEHQLNSKLDTSLLSESDRSYLRTFINDTYLTETAMTDIRTRFGQESSIQLRHFINNDWVHQIQDHMNRAESKCQRPKHDGFNYTSGQTKQWNSVGPAHKQRFLEFHETHHKDESYDISSNIPDDPDTDAMGLLLYQIRSDVFESVAFDNYIAAITRIGYPTGVRGRVRRFRPGLDYTVAHYGLLTEQSVLDATLCFVTETDADAAALRDDITKSKQAETAQTVVALKNMTNDDVHDQSDDYVAELTEAMELWQSGDCGGFECYIAADDDDDDDVVDGEDENVDNATKKGSSAAVAADEYNADDDDTELLNVSASNNTLSLVYRDPGTMRFIKYVSARAPSSRYDIAMEYEFPHQEESDDEDDDDDDEYAVDVDNKNDVKSRDGQHFLDSSSSSTTPQFH